MCIKTCCLRYHIVDILAALVLQFEPYIEKGNEGFVHHLLIYECHNRGQFNDSVHYGPGFDCHDYANMPFLECYFYSVVAAWAVGAEVKSLRVYLILHNCKLIGLYSWLILKVHSKIAHNQALLVSFGFGFPYLF